MSNIPVLSAEEILDAQYRGKQYSALKDKEVFAAMEQFARQESIEFVKWIILNGWTSAGNYFKDLWEVEHKRGKEDDEGLKSTSDLYEMYLIKEE